MDLAANPTPDPRNPGSLPATPDPLVRAAFGHLLDQLDGVPLPQPCGWRLLVLQYVRPERSAGGVYIPEAVKQEDRWQGRVGLVLAMGPGCWADRARYPEGPWAAPGDVVVWPKLDTTSSRLSYGKGIDLVLVNDDAVLARGVDALKAVG